MTDQQIDGVPVTSGTLEAAMSDDGARLGDLPLARDLGLPHAGADGRHADEPSPFHDGDLVGVLGAVCVATRMRPDAGEAGRSAIGKAVADGADGPVEVTRTGLVGDAHGDRVRHGGESMHFAEFFTFFIKNVGRLFVKISFTSVVLPDPFSPTNATFSPFLISNRTFFNPNLLFSY